MIPHFPHVDGDYVVRSYGPEPGGTVGEAFVNKEGAQLSVGIRSLVNGCYCEPGFYVIRFGLPQPIGRIEVW